MKGRFNIPMTEYYIEGQGIKNLEHIVTVCNEWLEEQGYRYKRYIVMPDKQDIIFQIVYDTPPQFQVDAFNRNLTNYKF